MGKTLAFIHTSHVLIPIFTELAKTHLHGTETFHMTDESLIRNTISAGELTNDTVRRVAAMIGLASDGGADAVMVTCSSIGKATALARNQYDFPILRIDEALAEKAVGVGGRIGVVATLRTTLNPTLELLRETAAQANREVELVPALAEGAFEAVLAGDTERHDALLMRALNDLMERVDVVVLAQASMARVAARVASRVTALLPAGGPPVLASPELAILRAKEVLQAMNSR